MSVSVSVSVSLCVSAFVCLCVSVSLCLCVCCVFLRVCVCDTHLTRGRSVQESVKAALSELQSVVRKLQDTKRSKGKHQHPDPRP